MSVKGYTTCRIQFIPNDKQRAERNYSERSLLELKQYDFGDYSLRALDIENKKEEIFTLPLKQEKQYKFGNSLTRPDEVTDNNGTYCLWLNANSRNQFYEALRETFVELSFITETPPPRPPSPSPPPRRKQDDVRKPPRTPSPPSPSPPPRRKHDDVRKPTTRSSPTREREPDVVQKPNSRLPTGGPTHIQEESRTALNRNELVAEVYRLGEYIRKGDVDHAVELVEQLADLGVRLQAKPWTERSKEKKVQIRVKIDSTNRRISNADNNELDMDVYPSTTVGELRAAFEYSHQFPSANQYFFVNGHLAHETSSMDELDVQPNSLFVLFVIQA